MTVALEPQRARCGGVSRGPVRRVDGRVVRAARSPAATQNGCAIDRRAAARRHRRLRVDRRPAAGAVPASWCDDLNDEAQTRQLAVMSREQPSAYRVRGYLAAAGRPTARTTISWVWDVYDGDKQRALRITGERDREGPPPRRLEAADDAMLRRIARSSMERTRRLPDLGRSRARHARCRSAAQMTLTSASASPEAAGIFRMFRPMPTRCRRKRSRTGRRRRGAAAAPPPDAGGLCRRRDADAGRRAGALNRVYAVRKSFGTTASGVLPGFAPPCYHHAAGRQS